MRFGWLFATAIAVTSFAVAAEPSVKVRDTTIIPAANVLKLLKQCSRSVPENVSGVWQPSPAQVKELEARLPAAILPEFPDRTIRRLPEFALQYGGIIVEKRHLIYVNAFPYGEINSFGSADRWRQEPLIVCDGGPVFWGSAYDPERKAFGRFQFNGPY